ncbi:hypothetical protein RSO01_58040 [Reyranella soli]|uniref:Uncharacterized protein n=2 Tax=Reyranella soli TaxID=1230389 RepID=A0A512NI60_9HYPH|nr:hypothetical protein RSO01_58040 [Reyranella soli]
MAPVCLTPRQVAKPLVTDIYNQVTQRSGGQLRKLPFSHQVPHDMSLRPLIGSSLPSGSHGSALLNDPPTKGTPGGDGKIEALSNVGLEQDLLY